MMELLKYIYLLDVKGVRKNIELLWSRYQRILDNEKSSCISSDICIRKK